MPSVFISYRRDDSAGFAGRLTDALEQRLGAGSVFRDVDDIAAGADFGAVIEDSLRRVQAVLVVIGPHWIGAIDAGGPRLEQAGDYVRREVELALASGKPVIPVLVGGAPMPAAAALPSSMRALANRNALTLGDANWAADLARLEAALASWLPAAARPARSRRGLIVMAAVLVLALAGGARWWSLRDGAPNTPEAAAVLGEWSAEVAYPWNLRVREHYIFTLDNGRISGSASFLGVARALEAAAWNEGRLRFQTRSQTVSGDEPARELVQRYELWRDGEIVRVRLQIQRGRALDAPFEFIAQRQ